MSQLTISNTSFGQLSLNVLAFSAPIYGTIASFQTKKLQQHFPIRASQPEIRFALIFASEAEYQTYQIYIRNVQLDALTSANPGISMFWPQRDIINWTGMPRNTRAGGQRANYAPRATLEVQLVDSMISAGSSATSSFPTNTSNSIGGVGSPDGVFTPPPQRPFGGQSGFSGVAGGGSLVPGGG